MAFDFPASPTVGQTFTPAAGVTYTWNGYAWAFANPTVIMQDAPPASPAAGSMWLETDTGTLWMWYVDVNSAQWISVGGPGAAGLVGVIDGSNAPAGIIGEYKQAILGAPVTPTVSVITNVFSLALGAGDWDAWTNIAMIPSAAGTMEFELNAAGTLSGAFPNYQIHAFMAAGSYNAANFGPLRFSSASAITVTLMVRAGAAGQQINRAFIAARRAR
jgi:hypothetical protein